MSKGIPDRRTAIAGEVFVSHEREITVMPKPEDASDRGHWFCISCAAGLRHNAEKDSHCGEPEPKRTAMVLALGDPARHVLGWVNGVTGDVEEP